ncbi:MAG: HU family DNA-binding protein [Bdellovibrionota bacterium]|nr:MAG: integration host factor [Pseudomonadota bacterium]
MAKKKAKVKKAGTKAVAGKKGKLSAGAPKAKAKKEPRVASSGPKNFEKVSKVRTKSQILATLSEQTGLSKKEVGGIFEILGTLIGHDLTKGPGTFTVPGLMKVTVTKKPATKARKGTNPFTGEEMMFKAKPARNVVKVRALKGLKDMV